MALPSLVFLQGYYFKIGFIACSFWWAWFSPRTKSLLWQENSFSQGPGKVKAPYPQHVWAHIVQPIKFHDLFVVLQKHFPSAVSDIKGTASWQRCVWVLASENLTFAIGIRLFKSSHSQLWRLKVRHTWLPISKRFVWLAVHEYTSIESF